MRQAAAEETAGKHLMGVKFKPSKSRTISIVRGRLVDERFHANTNSFGEASQKPRPLL